MQPQTTSDENTTHPTSGTTPAPPDGEVQGGFPVAATLEPTPHPSTKPEAAVLKDPEVKDFGWNSEPKAVPSPLIHGVSNDDLYILIRRFNKVSNCRNVSSFAGVLTINV